MRNKERFWLKQRWQQEPSSCRLHEKTLGRSTPGAAWDHCLAKHWVMFSISCNTPALKDPGSASFTSPALTITAARMRTFHLFPSAACCRKWFAKAHCCGQGCLTYTCCRWVNASRSCASKHAWQVFTASIFFAWGCKHRAKWAIVPTHSHVRLLPL